MDNHAADPTTPLDAILRQLAEAIDSGHVAGLALAVIRRDGEPIVMHTVLPAFAEALNGAVAQLFMDYTIQRNMHWLRERTPRVVRPVR